MSKKFKNKNNNEVEYEPEVEEVEEAEEKKEVKGNGERKVQVLTNVRGWTCRIKLIERVSKKGNKVIFLRLSQGRRIDTGNGTKIIGGKIDVPIFRFRHFMDDVRQALGEVIGLLSPDDIVSVKNVIKDMLRIVEEFEKK